MTSTVYTKVIQPNNQEYNQVKQEFLTTMGKDEFNILQIEKMEIENLKTLHLHQKSWIEGKGVKSNLKKLFYGTQNCLPIELMTSMGFDLRDTVKIGPYGLGNYFYKDAIIAHDFAYENEEKKEFQLLYCDVVLGNCETIEEDKTLVDTSTIPGRLFISSISNTSSSMFVIYNQYQAYPSYLITYKYSTCCP